MSAGYLVHTAPRYVHADTHRQKTANGSKCTQSLIVFQNVNPTKCTWRPKVKRPEPSLFPVGVPFLLILLNVSITSVHYMLDVSLGSHCCQMNFSPGSIKLYCSAINARGTSYGDDCCKLKQGAPNSEKTAHVNKMHVAPG